MIENDMFSHHLPNFHFMTHTSLPTSNLQPTTVCFISTRCTLYVRYFYLFPYFLLYDERVQNFRRFGWYQKCHKRIFTPHRLKITGNGLYPPSQVELFLKGAPNLFCGPVVISSRTVTLRHISRVTNLDQLIQSSQRYKPFLALSPSYLPSFTLS